MERYKGTGKHWVTEKVRKRQAAKARNKRRKKRQKGKTNFRLIRGLHRTEKLRLQGRPTLSFSRYLESKRPKPEIVKEEPKSSKKEKVKIHSRYRENLTGKKERRTEMKVINSRRDKKKELEIRIARQREKSRVRTKNKKDRKEKLKEKRKAA